MAIDIKELKQKKDDELPKILVCDVETTNLDGIKHGDLVLSIGISEVDLVNQTVEPYLDEFELALKGRRKRSADRIKFMNFETGETVQARKLDKHICPNDGQEKHYIYCRFDCPHFSRIIEATGQIVCFKTVKVNPTLPEP